jgi:hypothetical protein
LETRGAGGLPIFVLKDQSEQLLNYDASAASGRKLAARKWLLWRKADIDIP